MFKYVLLIVAVSLSYGCATKEVLFKNNFLQEIKPESGQVASSSDEKPGRFFTDPVKCFLVILYVIKTMKKSTCPTVRTKKGVKKLDEQYENTQFQLIHESVQLSDCRMSSTCGFL